MLGGTYMTREELMARAEELKKEEKYLDDKQHKLWEDSQKLENDFLETAIYTKGTVFSYISSLVSLTSIECKATNYKSYKYDILYSLNFINTNGQITGMTVLRNITESKLKEMISENKLILHEDEIKISTTQIEWPKELRPKYIKASRTIGESENIHDFIIETEECENNRKKIKKYTKKLYRVQTTADVKNSSEWFIKPVVATNKEGEIKEEFFMYKKNSYRRKRIKDRYSCTYVSEVNEDDLLEILLDFND